MKDKIIEILSKHMEDYQDGEFFHYALIANEILALFEKEQEYYKSFFGHIRKKGDCTAMEDYSERIDYAGIDPVKWGEVDLILAGERRKLMPKPLVLYRADEEDATKTWLECIRGTWRGLVPDSWVSRFLVSDRWFEDKEGIVDTEIIK